MTSGLPASVADWSLAETDGERIVGCRRTAMGGGTVAARIERIDIDLATADDRPCTIAVVQKWTWRHEVLGLRAAQAARPAASAVPRLLADGTDGNGHWLITPFYEGTVVARALVPGEVFESLARLHVAYAQAWTDLAGIPVVDAEWWRGICLSFALGAVNRQAAHHPSPTLERARSVLERMADDERVGQVLARLPRSLLHGDVHTGNIVVGDTGSTLVDWGSARIGPPMLDLANVTSLDAPGFAAYATAWHQSTGERLDQALVQLGYRWAAVQIPIQYLAWLVEYRSPAEVDGALDRAEHALALLRAS